MLFQGQMKKTKKNFFFCEKQTKQKLVFVRFSTFYETDKNKKSVKNEQKMRKTEQKRNLST
jgi:hypothetical protein